jgi:hypothetical protein
MSYGLGGDQDQGIQQLLQAEEKAAAIIKAARDNVSAIHSELNGLSRAFITITIIFLFGVIARSKAARSG